jgi:hypothetical protein
MPCDNTKLVGRRQKIVLLNVGGPHRGRDLALRTAPRCNSVRPELGRAS